MRKKSKELASVFTIGGQRPKDLYENSTWRAGNILEEQARKEFQEGRLTRYENVLTDVNSSVGMKYLNPNMNVLKLRLIRTNNVYDMIQKQRARDEEFRRYNFYNPARASIGIRPLPYSGSVPYTLNLLSVGPALP
jgi:hypothetical protein